MTTSTLRSPLTRLEREHELRLLQEQERRHYRIDPFGYARDVLGVDWWAKQQEIAEALLKPPYRVLVKASQNIGKTHLGGGLVNFWYDSHDPGIVLTTAPTDRQVHDLLWKEVRMQRGQRGGFPGPQVARLESSPDHFAHGFTARDGNAFQGHHAEHMLIVFDEAVGIAPTFWEAAEGMFAGEGHAWLAIFNPTDTSSQAYAEELSGNWHSISVSALEHPNITAELRGERPPFPAALRLARLEVLLKAWTSPVAGAHRQTDIEWPPSSGTWLRPGPLAEARLLGRWPSQATNSVWADGVWQACETANLAEPKDEPPEIGCDVARFGDDFTSIHVRCGPVSLHHETANGWGTDETAGRLKQLADWWGKRAGMDPRKVLIKIDDDGVGGGVTDQKAGYNFVGLLGAQRAFDEEGYPNRRSEMWFSTAERAADGRLDLSRINADTRRELRRQALAPLWQVDSQGRRVVEPKDKTKSRIKRSPDDMDALNISYSPPRRRWTAL